MLRPKLLSLLEVIRKEADATELMRRFVISSDIKKLAGDGFHVLVVGKAATGMYEGLVSRMPCKNARVLALRAKGKACKPRVHREFHQICCDHPLPTQRNVRAARTVQEFVAGVPEDGSLLVLLSGGASAFLSLPVDGLDLNMLRGVTGDLQRSGATIHEINAVRKQIEQLKGGRLGSMCATKRVSVAVLSDVLGDKIEVIGSGPFAPPAKDADALEVMKKYGLLGSHARVTAYLKRQTHNELAVNGKKSIKHDVIGSNSRLVDAVVSRCNEMKLRVHHAEYACDGEASLLGERIAKHITSRSCGEGVCIFGGEPTVNATRSRGVGGPSMEVALKAAVLGAGLPNWALLAYSTDGRDGPTLGAGAVVDGTSANAMKSRGVDPVKALARHDSFVAHQRAGTLIKARTTGTNVNHIYVLLRQ